MHDQDLERLIQTITDLVLARLQSAASEHRARVLTVLWPVPASHRELLLAGVNAFRQPHTLVQWLVHDPLVEGLTPLLPAGERCYPMSMAPLESLLGSATPRDVVLLAATHLSSTAQLLDMNDDLPWVQVLLQALLKGQQVLACDDLLRSTGRTPVAQRATSLLQELEAFGVTTTGASGLAKVLRETATQSGFAPFAQGGLLTEEEVVALVRAGQRELRLGPTTLVTPLATTKAAELGLALVWSRD